MKKTLDCATISVTTDCQNKAEEIIFENFLEVCLHTVLAFSRCSSMQRLIVIDEMKKCMNKISKRLEKYSPVGTTKEKKGKRAKLPRD